MERAAIGVLGSTFGLQIGGHAVDDAVRRRGPRRARNRWRQEDGVGVLMDDRIRRLRQGQHLRVGPGPPLGHIELVPQLVIADVRLGRAVVMLDQRGEKILPVLDVVGRRGAIVKAILGDAGTLISYRPGGSAVGKCHHHVDCVGRGVDQPALLRGGDIAVEDREVEIAPGALDLNPGELLVGERAERHAGVLASLRGDAPKKSGRDRSIGLRPAVRGQGDAWQDIDLSSATAVWARPGRDPERDRRDTPSKQSPAIRYTS